MCKKVAGRRHVKAKHFYHDESISLRNHRFSERYTGRSFSTNKKGTHVGKGKAKKKKKRASFRVKGVRPVSEVLLLMKQRI